MGSVAAPFASIEKSTLMLFDYAKALNLEPSQRVLPTHKLTSMLLLTKRHVLIAGLGKNVFHIGHGRHAWMQDSMHSAS